MRGLRPCREGKEGDAGTWQALAYELLIVVS
jgi:hypothetical protein